MVSLEFRTLLSAAVGNTIELTISPAEDMQGNMLFIRWHKICRIAIRT